MALEDHRRQTRQDILRQLNAADVRVSPRAAQSLADRLSVLFPAEAEFIRTHVEQICLGATEGHGSPDVDMDAETIVAHQGSRDSSAAGAGGDPETLGQYRILSRLGQGGMGVVYLAQDPSLNRLVAIKVLPPRLAGQKQALERFRREAQAIIELSHPAIVPIYEVGEDQGFHYYVMRHVDGQTYRDFARDVLNRPETTEQAQPTNSRLLRQAVALFRTSTRMKGHSRLSLSGLDAVLKVAEDIARGLAHAHGHGVIHRDIKPANIMVDAQGSGLLLDFGLAKADFQATMTRSGHVMGTFAYMAPEQISEDFGEISPQTDIYAMGVSLFECLCGQRPFQGASSEALMFQALHRQPPSPTVFVPDLSRDVETIVLKCLEKKPERRYASASDLAEDLARVRAHKRIEAQPVGLPGRCVRWAETHRGLAFMLVAIFLTVSALPLLAWQRSATARAQRVREATAQEELCRGAMTAFREESKKASHCETEITDILARHLGRDVRDAREKKRLEELRTQRAALRSSMRRHALEAQFTYVRALEIDPDLDSSLRDAWQEFLFDRLLRAEKERDQITVATLKAALHNGPFGNRLQGTGLLSLVTSPARCGYEIARADDARTILSRGQTPIQGLELEAGSYVVRLSSKGHRTISYPILIERGEHWGERSWHEGRFAQKDWTVALPGTDVADASWMFVPGGPFLSLLNRDRNPEKGRHDWRWVESFFMAALEVDGASYQRFLDDPEVKKERSPKAPYRLLPRFLSGDADPRYVASPRGRSSWPGIRSDMLDLPVGSLSQRNARRFARWLAAGSQKPIRLPSALQWEKAARSVDGRLYPWGNQFQEKYLRIQRLVDNRIVEPWPVPLRGPDISLYGIHNLAGSLREWSGDGHDLGDGLVNPYLLGGSALLGTISPRSFMTVPREFMAFDNVLFDSGIRLVMSWQERDS